MPAALSGREESRSRGVYIYIFISVIDAHLEFVSFPFGPTRLPQGRCRMRCPIFGRDAPMARPPPGCGILPRRFGAACCFRFWECRSFGGREVLAAKDAKERKKHEIPLNLWYHIVMKRLLTLLAVAAFLAGGCGLFKPRGYPYSELAKRFPPYRKAEFHTAVGAKTGLFCYHGMWQASAATNAITWIGDKEELWRTPDLPCEWIIQIFENESGEKLYMIYRFQP